jgi:hypothetical protein
VWLVQTSQQCIACIPPSHALSLALSLLLRLGGGEAAEQLTQQPLLIHGGEEVQHEALRHRRAGVGQLAGCDTIV